VYRLAQPAASDEGINSTKAGVEAASRQPSLPGAAESNRFFKA
jgi:hypothetical protein